ncbi:MAG: hypothetical protein FJX75_14460 [Armatimonadetes bacterium]|nr:hypothetical protein [Armatimonadota bacterium]
MLQSLALLVTVCRTAGAVPQTPTGFYYPTDAACSCYNGWLDGVPGRYHLGCDTRRPEGSAVYAIAAGEVTFRYDPPSGWDDYGNYCLVIKHCALGHGDFEAYYGHIQTGIGVGALVSAGQPIGTIGNFAGDDDHLHFAVNPDCRRILRSVGYTSSLGDTKGFVDPCWWIENRAPCGYVGCPNTGWVRQKWQEGYDCSGGVGQMGLPIGCTEEWRPPGSAWGYRQPFEKGWLLNPPDPPAVPYKEEPGVYGLRGELLRLYEGFYAGDLGWALTCWKQWAGQTPRGALEVWVMGFERGHIIEIVKHTEAYWEGRYAASFGDVWRKWDGVGGLASTLGAPIDHPYISSVHLKPEEHPPGHLHQALDTWEQKFEGGYIARVPGATALESYPYVWSVDDGDPMLWWDDLGTRRAFPSWEPFCDFLAARDLPYTGDLLPVVRTKLARCDLEAIAAGRIMPPLVGTIGSPDVWYIDCAKPTSRRHLVPNMTVFGNWGFQSWEVSWLRADHPHRKVSNYAEAAALPDFPPKVTITSLPAKAWIGPPIVVRWKTEGFPGNQVSKTNVTWRVNCGVPVTTPGTSLGNGEYEAEIPTVGVWPALTKGDTVWVHVYAEGDGLPADDPDGSAGDWWRGVIIGTDSIPTLRWAGGAGYTSDGVNPDQGIAKQTRFVWKVKYADADGDAPLYVRVEIRRNGKLLRNTLALQPKTGSLTAGRIYAGGRRLPLGTSYEYRFVAEDHDGVATGTPTAWKAGPVVTAAAPAQVAEASLGLAGVSTAPVRAGGVQITFALTTKASVVAEVLNVAGRSVRVICRDRECVKGRNAILWDGRSDAGTTAPPGIYLVKLHAYTEGGQQAQSLTSVRVVR